MKSLEYVAAVSLLLLYYKASFLLSFSCSYHCRFALPVPFQPTLWCLSLVCVTLCLINVTSSCSWVSSLVCQPIFSLGSFEICLDFLVLMLWTITFLHYICNAFCSLHKYLSFASAIQFATASTLGQIMLLRYVKTSMSSFNPKDSSIPAHAFTTLLLK